MKSDYSPIPMIEDFKKRLDKIKQDMKEDDRICFDSEQEMEEFVIKEMTGIYFFSYHTEEEKIEFVRNIYRIGRTVGLMLK